MTADVQAPGEVRGERAAMALALGGIGIAGIGTLTSRSLHADELAPLRQPVDATGAGELMAPVDGQFVVVGPVIVPREGLLWLGSALVVAGIVGFALTRWRLKPGKGRMKRWFDPLALGLIAIASALAAYAWTPPDMVSTVLVTVMNIALSLTAYVAATGLMWLIAWRRR